MVDGKTAGENIRGCFAIGSILILIHVDAAWVRHEWTDGNRIDAIHRLLGNEVQPIKAGGVE